MTFTSITGLLNTLSSLSLAAFVFLRRPQHRTNQAYLFFGFTVALYSAGYFLWGLAQSEADALFAFKILTSGIILINSTYLEFVFSLLEERRGKKIILWTCHLINLFFIYAVFSLLLFKTVAKKNIWGYWPVVENLFYVYFVLWLGQFLYGLFHLYRGYKSTTGQRSTQIEYVFASTLIGYFGGATNWLPWFNFTFFPPHLNFLVTVYVAILAYAVVRHSLLDIEVIIRKTLVFAGLFGMVMLIVTSVTALLQNYLEQFLSMIPTLSVGLSGLIIILLYEPSKSWLVGITDRFLFQKGYSYDEIEDEIASCSEITDLNELCRRITEIFLKKMSLVRASLFLFEKDEGIFKAAASMGTSSLPEKVPAAKSPFDLIFKMQGKVFRTGDLQNLPEGLKSIELVVKISYQEELIALLLLGKKKSDKDYSNDDIRFFEITAKHMANILNIAKMFHFQRDFYMLQTERNRSDMLSQLSGGLDHEIKNPLNQSMPRMWLALKEMNKALEERGEDRVLTRAIELIEVAHRHSGRIDEILSRLRRFSRPIPERDRIELKALNLLQSIREAVGLISETRLRDDNIVVECSVLKDVDVLADETLLVQSLYNIINNAYHATNRNGTITISNLQMDKNSIIRVAIRDTGHGIKPEHVNKIFEPFFTTKPTNPQGDDIHRFKGTGLGLSLVKRYMEECGGSISFESEVGKGTTFYLDFRNADVKSGHPHSASTETA